MAHDPFDCSKEVWKVHPVRINYEISNWGGTRSIPHLVRVKWKSGPRKGIEFDTLVKGRVIKQWNLHGSNYRQVDLGRGYRESVHVLVLETFVGPCPEGMECRHLDGKGWNNYLNNLRWGTPTENAQDREKHGTGPKVTCPKGEKCSWSKLTKTIVKKIRSMYATGLYSQKELGLLFGIHQVTVSEIVTRKIWKHI